jgi:hypothetical protein
MKRFQIFAASFAVMAGVLSSGAFAACKAGAKSDDCAPVERGAPDPASPPQATSGGIPSTAPYASGGQTYPADSGRELYVTRNQPGPKQAGGVALFSNDPHLKTTDIIGPVSEYGVVTALLHNTNGASPLLNDSGFEVLGWNDAAGSGSGQTGANNMVGFYSNITCRVAGARCWGANPEVNFNNGAGDRAHPMGGFGLEVDINNGSDYAGKTQPASNHVSASGVYIVGNSYNAGENIIGLNLGLLDNDGKFPAVKWSRAMYVQPGASAVAMEVGQLATGPKQGSMPLHLDWTDNAGTGHAVALAANNAGALTVNGAAGLSTTVTISGCTLTFTSGLLTAKNGC